MACSTSSDDVFAWHRLLNPRGRFATSANSATVAIILTSVLGPRRVQAIFAMPRREELDALTAAVTAGALTPQVGAAFPLAQIADAHRAFGTTRGKVLVTI
jgi:NADPH:quinone reductase-like Zn-dependent oxidoreductase